MVLVCIEVHKNSQNEMKMKEKKKETNKDSFKVSDISCYFLPSHSRVMNVVCERFKYHLACYTCMTQSHSSQKPTVLTLSV